MSDDVNPKERLIEYLGQSVADAIEAEYWIEEILNANNPDI